MTPDTLNDIRAAARINDRAFRCERIDALVEAAKAREEADAKDAARYRVLRGDGSTQSAYGPEEEGIWGGDELDEYCDGKLAASGTARQSLPAEEGG